MSAPTTHDPLVVNTKDGVTWLRRAVTRDGHGLYAVTDSCKCPPYLMATLAELAEHGIAGSADVLPMPVGPEPQGDPVAAGRRLDLLALMDDRTASAVSPVLAAVLTEAERLRARVAELESQLAALAAQGEALRDRAAQGSADKLTRLLAPVQALREDDPNGLHHTYRVSRDLPELGGA